MILYHGATIRVEHPLCNFGRADLDFGKGFYLTDLLEQAEEWAARQADSRKEPGILNVYEFDKERTIKEYRYLLFSAYDRDWLHFIVNSRNGRKPWENYDIIEGGVANDRVVDTVNLYSLGLMDEETALSRLSEHKPNNQICILNQEIVEKYLFFKEVIAL
ncbi:MAG: DUF3990 domain-containing protein [Bacteroidales bacterium]|nr:DUF3990 domain-containing protein [Candidatus Cacconaster scatequi]